MRVQDADARAFYEQEAVECGWSKAQLERQIQSAYYQRIIANQDKAGLVSSNRERLLGEHAPAETILKSPYVNEKTWPVGCHRITILLKKSSRLS